MPTLGDTDLPQLTVDPYDGTTAAALLVIAPDNTTSAPGASSADSGHTWTADPVLLDQPGWWVYTWTVTGTGAGAQPQRVFVTPNPAAGGPVWTPDRERVASYVPKRTLVGVTNTAVLTFTDQTRPTGTEVDALIADAVNWVLVKVSDDIEPHLIEFATATAAVYAAGMVERTYPTRAGDLTTADSLLKQASSMRDDLAKANQAATGEDPTDPAAQLLPQYSFPDPYSRFGLDARYDEPYLFS